MILYVSAESYGTVTDPYWGDVILLLNGSGSITKDSSSFNRTLGSSGTPTFNSGLKLFGVDTYDIGSSDQITIASDAFVATAFGNSEFCFEFFFYPQTQGVDTRFISLQTCEFRWASTGAVSGTVFGIASSSYTLTSASGIAPANTWAHVAMVRDKTDSTFDYLKLYVEGVLRATSAGILKTNSVDTGDFFGQVLGYFTSGSLGHFANYRVTANHARYYGTFTPPSAAFPTS